MRENMRAGHDGNQRGACLKRVGGASMRRRVGHGGVAPRWGCPAVAAVCREGPSHQERGDPVDGHTAILLPILPRLARSLRLAAGRGVQWSGKLGEATRGGEGAFSRTRSPGLFSHVSPPAPLPRSLRRLLAPSLPPTSFPFPSQSLAYFPIFQPSHASRCRRVYKRGDWGRARQRVGGVTHGKERKVRTSER